MSNTFWSLSVLFLWKGIKENKLSDWILFGIFAAFGVLSKYLFIYLLIVMALFTLNFIIKNKVYLKSLISLFHFFNFTPTLNLAYRERI